LRGAVFDAFAADFLAGDFLAGDFFAADFLAGDVLAADDLVLTRRSVGGSGREGAAGVCER
jgi:hypothetical protein